jgi:hypothetical protein
MGTVHREPRTRVNTSACNSAPHSEATTIQADSRRTRRRDLESRADARPVPTPARAAVETGLPQRSLRRPAQGAASHSAEPQSARSTPQRKGISAEPPSPPGAAPGRAERCRWRRLAGSPLKNLTQERSEGWQTSLGSVLPGRTSAAGRASSRTLRLSTGD